MGPNKTAKLKIRGYPAGTIQLIFFASFLPQNACRFGAKKMVAKSLDLAKQKGIENVFNVFFGFPPPLTVCAFFKSLPFGHWNDGESDNEINIWMNSGLLRHFIPRNDKTLLFWIPTCLHDMRFLMKFVAQSRE
jgi:hypothetical protein